MLLLLLLLSLVAVCRKVSILVARLYVFKNQLFDVVTPVFFLRLK
jgi:hypothetical protein